MSLEATIEKVDSPVKRSGPWHVYEVRDPRDAVVVIVGASKDPKRRMRLSMKRASELDKPLPN